MNMSASMKQCYDLLNQTGRVYGATINHLNPEIRDAQCLFYVILRAADTIEDDMTIPADMKTTMLNCFGEYLQDVTWKYSHSNDEYAVVLEQFPCVTKALRELPRKYRSIILELAHQISQNMATFAGKEFITMEEINKVNFLRDFRKDWHSGRLNMAKDVWSKYVNNPGDFLKPENLDKGVECVNEMITDALQYAVPYLRVVNSLRSPSSIKFYGAHGVMVIATLELCYNNSRVFTELVKLERADSAEIMKSASTFAGVVEKFGYYTKRIKQRTCHAKEPTQGTVHICQQILHEIELIKSNQEHVVISHV